MSKKVFISHSVKDKVVVDALVDLLQLGGNVSSDDVFCSSLDGLGIAPGKNFIEYIKHQMQEPTVVLALISENYVASQFCLCELGAAWAMSHELLPLLMPPLKLSDVKGILVVTEITRIGDSEGLSEFMEQLKTLLSGKQMNVARWEAKKKEFLQRLPTLLESVLPPQIVALAEHNAVKKQLKDAMDAIDKDAIELKKRDQLIADLKKIKDKKEVTAAVLKNSSEAETLDQLENELSNILNDLPTVVAFVAFKDLGASSVAVIDGFQEPEYAAAARSATENRLLIDDDGRFSLDSTHPKIKRIITAFKRLQTFLDHEVSNELFKTFEDQNDFPMSLDNREYWNYALNSNLKRFSL